MKPDLIRRAIGGASTLLGLYWTYTVISPFWRHSSTDNTAIGYVFLLTMVPLMALPGILAIIFGVRLFRAMSLSSLKWTIGIFSTFGALFISSVLSRMFPDLLPERVASSAFLFVGIMIAIPVYLAILRLFLPYLSPEKPSPAFLFSRIAFFLAALQIWMLLSAIFREYSPIKEGYTHVPKEPWGILGFIVPIAVAVGLYRLAVKLFLPAKENQSFGSTKLEASP